MMQEDPRDIPKRESVLETVGKITVRYDRQAYEKVRYLVNSCPVELGWVEIVEKIDNYLYYIHDVRGFAQVGMPGTFSYTENARFEVMMELLNSGKMLPGYLDAGLGHSHVHGGVTPSGTDVDMMMTMQKLNQPFSIQTIHNKKGDMYASIYSWEQGRWFGDCEVDIASTLTGADIEDLDMQLDRVRVDYGYKRDYGKKWEPKGTGNVKEEEPQLSLAYDNDVVNPQYWGISEEEWNEWSEDQQAAFTAGISLDLIRAMGRTDTLQGVLI